MMHDFEVSVHATVVTLLINCRTEINVNVRSSPTFSTMLIWTLFITRPLLLLTMERRLWSLLRRLRGVTSKILSLSSTTKRHVITICSTLIGRRSRSVTSLKPTTFRPDCLSVESKTWGISWKLTRRAVGVGERDLLLCIAVTRHAHRVSLKRCNCLGGSSLYISFCASSQILCGTALEINTYNFSSNAKKSTASLTDLQQSTKTKLRRCA